MSSSRPTAPSQGPRPAQSLCSARCGIQLRVVAIRSNCSECLRLRELGLCEKSVLSKITEGAALLCSLAGTRLAIGRSLAEHIWVEPMPA